MVKHKKRSSCKVISDSITRPNCALDRRTILYLYVPAEFQRQVNKHVYFFVETMEINEGPKKEQRERPCCGIVWRFSKCTDWPREEVFRRFYDLNSFDLNLYCICL